MTDKYDRSAEPDSATDEAALWFSRFQLGTADAAAFERWRAASPDNAVRFARVAAMWDKLAYVDKAVPAAESPAPVSRRHMLRAASVAALLVAGGGAFVERSFARTRISSDVGELRSTTLPDTSSLALNTDSQASWRFGKDERALWLERGEIAVTLQPGTAEPVLYAGRITARLTAGRYDARIVADTVDLLVIRGGALVADGADAPVRLGPGQSIAIGARGKRERVRSPEEVNAALAWQDGEIVFLDEPLAAAVAEYNRHLTRKIILADPAIRSIRLGGRFTSTDPAPFLTALSATFPIRVVRSDGAILLYAKK